MSYVVTSARLRRRRGLSGLGATTTVDGVTYQLIYGSTDNTPTYLPDKQVAIQNLMRQTYSGNYAPVSFWAGVFQQVMGEPYPQQAVQIITASYAGTPSAGADVQFVDIWMAYLKVLGKWPAMPGIVVPGQYYLAPAPVGNQAPPVPLPISAFGPAAEAAQAAAVTAPAPVTAANAATSSRASGVSLGSLLTGSFALGIPNWAWLAGGAGALFLFGRGR